MSLELKSPHLSSLLLSTEICFKIKMAAPASRWEEVRSESPPTFRDGPEMNNLCFYLLEILFPLFHILWNPTTSQDYNTFNNKNNKFWGTGYIGVILHSRECSLRYISEGFLGIYSFN